MAAVERRKPGPKPKITGTRLLDLIAYMKHPDATTASAALEFGVSGSTIEKTLSRLRKEEEAEAAKKSEQHQREPAA